MCCIVCCRLSARRDFSHLVRSMPLSLIVPVTSTLTIALPPAGTSDAEHKLFAADVTIQGIKDDITVQASMQQPKKVSLQE